MSGVTAATGLEVFTQPDDLEITVSDADESGKHAIIISRGPGHDFKLLLTTEPVFESKEQAVEAVKDSLEVISERARTLLANPSDILGSIINPDGLPIEEMNVLTPERVAQIVEDLNDNGVAKTYKASATA